MPNIPLSPEEELQHFVTSLGVLAEISLAYNRSLKNAGASDEEAYELTKAFLEASMESFGKDPPEKPTL